MTKTVAVGLSGGVDSTLCALLLREQGYRVVGLTMSIYNKDIPQLKTGGNACYGPVEKEDVGKVRQWCAKEGIKLMVLDCSEEYKQTVLAYFKEAYLSGITPNPCVKCNAEMKFGLLQRKARASGLEFDYFATGHYARIEASKGRFSLYRGVDGKKDQSYFLYRLTQEQLSQTLFPLGALTKDQTRALARERGLAVADKADSQDFYVGNYSDLLQQPPREGKIIHKNGQILGRHQGFWNYTIGQRKGLGVAYKEPLFVVDLDPEHNAVIVAEAGTTLCETCRLDSLVWGGAGAPNGAFEALVKYRSSGRLVPAVVQPDGAGASVRFQEPQRAVCPGQSLVFYADERVVGGGVILKP